MMEKMDKEDWEGVLAVVLAVGGVVLALAGLPDIAMFLFGALAGGGGMKALSKLK